MYKNKYLKYKQKYLELQNQLGGECNPRPTAEESDPISLEHLDTLQPDEIITLTTRRDGITHRQCYKITSIYTWIRNNPTDPITRTPLTRGNIAAIRRAYAYLQLLPLQLRYPDRIEESEFEERELRRVKIPNTVITIGTKAFANNELSKVIIPNSVITIGESAFASNELSKVTIPNSVITIDKDAFAYNQLESVIIPNSVITIGLGAFDVNPLTSVTIPRRFQLSINDIFDNTRNIVFRYID